MTIDALGPALRWLLALHVIAVIAWMAGLFYLPRLFVYHCGTARGSAESERFKVMERRLLKQIMLPAMLASLGLGVLLALTPGAVDWASGWWWTKLVSAVALMGFQGACGRWRRGFLEDRNTRSHRFYRAANEVPTVLMVVIVIMAVVHPF